MESIRGFFKNAMNYVSHMTASQVMMLLGIGGGTIVGAIFVVGWLNSVTYSRLYSDLDESEAGEVITWLNDNKIQYNLTGGGRTIEVPSGDVYKTRIGLASEGLQNLNFRRALEGELTRTIMQLNEVQAARVHIVMPKERLFKQDQKQSTASVVLKLNGNRSLSAHQINGITHLVASSVEGLEPSSIAIVDYDGNLLTSGTETDQLAGLTSSQLDVRKKVEDYLQSKAQSMLDEVLGAGKSVVRVTTDLDFQQVEKTSEMFDANSPSVRSEERTKTSLATSDKPSEASESTQDDNSETVITNYELNKTVEHLINAVGTVDRLSVAVLVDGVYSEVEGEDGAEMIYQPRSQEELDRLASIVKNSVGFDPQRNDQIEMVNIAFDRQNLEDDRRLLDTMYQQEFYWEMGKKIGLALLLLFVFFYVKKKSSKLFAALGKLVPATVPLPQQQMPSATSIMTEEPLEPVLPEKRQAKLIDKMQETAREEPEEIAKVIKTMMVE